METVESSSTPGGKHVPSDMAVSSIMQKGLQDIVLQTSAGIVLGGLAGIVLARGGGGSGARKALAGLGGGLGLGSAWTRTSMNLEELLTPVVGGGATGGGAESADNADTTTK